MTNLIYQIGKSINRSKRRILYHGEIKFFCIGKNKTGTTSLSRAFRDLGIRVGDQRQAELLSDKYFSHDFQAIVDYCRYARAFQDVPFSWPDTYRYMYESYPKSKFILTIRDDANEWYQSIISFYQKIYGGLTWQHLANSAYVKKGWSMDVRKKLYKITLDENPYEERILKESYIKHNQGVINFFLDKQDQLLVINLKEKDAYLRFCEFIDCKPLYENFPWENKTANIE